MDNKVSKIPDLQLPTNSSQNQNLEMDRDETTSSISNIEGSTDRLDRCEDEELSTSTLQSEAESAETNVYADQELLSSQSSSGSSSSQGETIAQESQPNVETETTTTSPLTSQTSTFTFRCPERRPRPAKTKSMSGDAQPHSVELTPIPTNDQDKVNTPSASKSPVTPSQEEVDKTLRKRFRCSRCKTNFQGRSMISLRNLHGEQLLLCPICKTPYKQKNILLANLRGRRRGGARVNIIN